jgi:hypothetical protein
MKLDGQIKLGIAALRFTPTNGHRLAEGSVADWASKINLAWGRDTASTLELARIVCAARSKLPHGAWTQLWKSGEVRFSKRKGDMLASIGKQLAELDEQTSAHLPAGWNILYHVSMLDLDTIKRHANTGTIHPGLTLREAKQLLAEFRGQPARNKSRKINVRQRLRMFNQFARSTMKDWSTAERELAAHQLKQLSEEIESRDNPPGVFNSTTDLFRIAPRAQLVSAASASRLTINSL